jgi:hypothetical protein
MYQSSNACDDRSDAQQHPSDASVDQSHAGVAADFRVLTDVREAVGGGDWSAG